jgi:cellulose synthase/poly-beta-1,6-N-acetylglucosamine synthase-like glycosyltransferase
MLWVYIYEPLINFLKNWQLVYQILFLIGIAFVVFSDGLIIPLAFYHYLKTRKMEEKIKFWAPITILIPAYNEEVNLARTIESVYAARYKGDKEIIVINDGSTDKTQEIAERYVEKGMIELINRKNGGKTAAINTGLVSARGEIIVVIDGDGVIKENALEEIVKKFQRPEVGAVAGNKVGNRYNIVTKIQHLEYLRDINIPRRAFNILRTVMVVPGPLGAFRRDVLRSVGEYDRDTKTEDFDLTVKMLKSKRPEIEVSQTAIAWTESPTTWRGLFKQRMRWYGGMLQTLRKHKDATTFSLTKYGNLGRFGGWYTFFFVDLYSYIRVIRFRGVYCIFIANDVKC